MVVLQRERERERFGVICGSIGRFDAWNVFAWTLEDFKNMRMTLDIVLFRNLHGNMCVYIYIYIYITLYFLSAGSPLEVNPVLLSAGSPLWGNSCSESLLF